MSERFTVEVDITAKDKTKKALSSTKRGFKDAFQEIGKGALRKAGEGLTNIAQQIPALVAEMTQLGIQSEAVGQRFERFAGGADRAAMFLEAFNEGTQGTVDRMSAMGSASRLLQMGLVDTGDEMSQISAIATRLGDQTMGAGDRISDFAALLANQSIPRLDNFGISSGRVRARIDELLKSGQALNREQAFKMAVMEQGAAALEKLGDTSGTAATKLAILKAAAQDAKVGVGELIVDIIGGVDGVEGFASRLRMLPETMRQVGMLARAAGAAIGALKPFNFDAADAMDEFNNSLKRSVAAQTDFKVASEEVRWAHTTALPTYEKEIALMETMKEVTRLDAMEGERFATVQGTMETATSRNAAAFSQYQDAINQASEATDNARFAMMQQAEAEKALDLQTRQLALGLSMSFTGQLDQMQEASVGFAKKREELETQHQEKLDELQKRGASRRIQINEQAEMEKLADLQFNLEQAQRRIDEMTGKEKESARIAKERTLAEAQEKYDAQKQMLEDFNAGRLIAAGENVSALIAEEDKRHQAAIAGLDEEMAKQQQIQEQALGNMILQAFDAWSEQKDIPIEKMLEMRTAVAEEYGLVSEGATELVTDMVGEWERWASDTKVSTDQVVQYMSGVVSETGEVNQALLDLTAEEWVIKVRYETSGRPPGSPNGGGGGTTGGGEPEFQFGGAFTVGEAGPERITVQPLGGNSTTNNYSDTFNIYDGRAMSAVQERRRRERRSAFARTM